MPNAKSSSRVFVANTRFTSSSELYEIHEYLAREFEAIDFMDLRSSWL